MLSLRPSLLLLDNLEHLMPDAVPILRDLLAQAPLLQCVVTSRQVLGLTPEREIAVGPLPVPMVSRQWSVVSTGRSERSELPTPYCLLATAHLPTA